MYHHTKIVSCIGLYLLLIACSLLPPAANCQAISTEKCPFPILAHAKAYKDRPAQMGLYQYDDKPLGSRAPLLLVHGLQAEFWPCLRWQKLVNHLVASPEFSDKYKIFCVRYDSRTALDKIVPQLQAKIAELYNASSKKPVTIIALSMGGSVVYQAMLQSETDKQVQLFLAMATPFHGSPLFSSDWLQYTIYKRVLWPITRIDHSLAYRFYFGDKSNLLTGLCWDNCDRSIPEAGQFASMLPFGPKGNLSLDIVNTALATANQNCFDKSKIIAYGAFLANPYQLPIASRFIEETLSFPYNVLTMTLPAHLAKEHSVLKMVNRQMSTVVTTQSAAKRSGTKFVYDLNDGIIPLISALFFPDRYSNTISISRESDLVRIKPLLDVRTGRVFRNMDHLTFLDGHRPITLPAAMQDELNPQAGKHNIFDWILFDLDCMQSDTRQSSTASAYN